MPKLAYVQSGRVEHSTAARSPGARPRPMSPRAISLTIWPSSRYESSAHSSPRLNVTAGRSPYLSAASGIMSAIVREPVDVGAAVLDSILRSSSSDLTKRDSRGDARPGAPLRRSGRGYLTPARWDRDVFAEVGQEQGLVDTALEDRHAHFHALLDDLATLHACLAREFRGREMDCHRLGASCEVCHVAPHGSAPGGRHQQQVLNTG